MKYSLEILFITVLASFSLQTAFAVEVVECEDPQGRKSFQKFCPPGSVQVRSKKIATGSSGSGKKEPDIKATLYVIPDCPECDEIKKYLQSNNVSPVVKNANESVDIQDELTEISGGLKIPTTVINEEVIVGYQQSKIKATLTKLSGKKEAKAPPNK